MHHVLGTLSVHVYLYTTLSETYTCVLELWVHWIKCLHTFHRPSAMKAWKLLTN